MNKLLNKRLQTAMTKGNETSETMKACERHHGEGAAGDET